MAGPNTLEFNESNFDEEVLQSSQPVLVDFWAEWCGPCKMLGPTIDEIATEYAGRVKVGKVDTDANQSLASRYHITGIPTVMLFKNGQIVKQQSGVARKNVFTAWLDEA